MNWALASRNPFPAVHSVHITSISNRLSSIDPGWHLLCSMVKHLLYFYSHCSYLIHWVFKKLFILWIQPYVESPFLHFETRGPWTKSLTAHISLQKTNLPKAMLIRAGRLKVIIIGWSYIWTKLNPLQARMLYGKCDWNWPSGLRKKDSVCKDAIIFYYYLPVKSNRGPSF